MTIAERSLVSLALTACMFSVQGQAPGAGNAPPSTPPLVLLTVATGDSKSAPAGDLTINDFKITDQGKAQRIVYFRKIENAPAAAPQSGEFSNRTGVTVPHHTAIMFDLLGQARQERVEAAKRIGKSLQELKNPESVFLYVQVLDGSLVPIHAMPQNAGTLTEADKTWTQTADQDLEKVMQSGNKAVPSQMNDSELVVKKTYVNLETLAKQLAAYAGRRDIIYMTGGIPTVSNPKSSCSGDWIDCSLYVPHLSVTLEQMGVAASTLTYASPVYPMNADMMDQFAGLTSGRSFYSEDIRAVLSQLDADASTGYLMAYEPSADNWDSKFHKLKVDTGRKNLKLRIRNRYYGLADTRPVAIKQQVALGAAFISASDVPDIGLRATVAAAAGAQKMIHLSIRIDAADLLLREMGDHVEGQLAIMFAGYGASGPKGSTNPANFNLRLTSEQRAKAMKEGLPFEQDFPADPTMTKIRFIVTDLLTGAVGTVSVPTAK